MASTGKMKKLPPRPTRTTAPSPIHGTAKRIPKALSSSTSHKRRLSHEVPRHRQTPTGMREERHMSFSIKRAPPRSVITAFGSATSKGYDPKKPEKEN